jgi:dihydrodipicolinate synthase/N-acetylneuraminate lyase
MVPQLYDTFQKGDTAGAMEIQEKINQVIALLIELCYCRTCTPAINFSLSDLR